MRDWITAFGVFFIVVLTAALTVPPLVSWDNHRALVDSFISQSTGLEARSSGAIQVKLLPSPRLKLEQMTLSESADNKTSGLVIHVVKLQSELGLTSLLKGDLRFKDLTIAGLNVSVPEQSSKFTSFLSDALPRENSLLNASSTKVSLDNVAVGLLQVSTVLQDGSVRQNNLSNIRLQARTAQGPWNIEGIYEKLPFSVGIAMPSDGIIPLQVSGGGDTFPRFEGKLNLPVSLKQGSFSVNSLLAGISGNLRLVMGPPVQNAGIIPLPLTVQANLKPGSEKTLNLADVTVEGGDTAQGLRLTGEGQFNIEKLHLTLNLAGQRLDLTPFILSTAGNDLVSGGWKSPDMPFPVALNLAMNSLGLGGQEMNDFSLKARLDQNGFHASRLIMTLPGATQITWDSNVQSGETITGRLNASTANSSQLAGFFSALGVSSQWTNILDGRAIEARTDASIAWPLLSFDQIQVTSLGLSFTGSAHYTAAEQENLPHLDMKMTAGELDLLALPRLDSLPFLTSVKMDTSLFLDVQNASYGKNRSQKGQMTVNLKTEKGSLIVKNFSINNVSNTSINAKGKITNDGQGQIEAKIQAQDSNLLVDLVEKSGVFGKKEYRLLDIVRAQPTDLTFSFKQAAAQDFQKDSSLNQFLVKAQGSLGEHQIKADFLINPQSIEKANIAVSARPSGVQSQFNMNAIRTDDNVMQLSLTGDLAGTHFETKKPFLFHQSGATLSQGALQIQSEDARPLFTLLTGLQEPQPLAIDASLLVEQERKDSIITFLGHIGGQDVKSRINLALQPKLSAQVKLEYFSLPWFIDRLVYNQAVTFSSRHLSTNVFSLINEGSIVLSSDALDFGRGVNGQNAQTTLTISPDGFRFQDTKANLLEGRLTGSLNVSHQGEMASLSGEIGVRDLNLSDVLKDDVFSGRVSGDLTFGTNGETQGTLAANLSGGGTLSVTQFSATATDPAAVERSLDQISQSRDLAASRKIASLIQEEMKQGAFSSTGFVVPATLVNGSLRLTPVTVESEKAFWKGSAVFDLKNAQADIRGILNFRTNPDGWTADMPPSLALSWKSTNTGFKQDVDPTLLITGVATNILQRETDQINRFKTKPVMQAEPNSVPSENKVQPAPMTTKERKTVSPVKPQQAAPRRSVQPVPLVDKADEDIDATATLPDLPQPLDIKPQTFPDKPETSTSSFWPSFNLKRSTDPDQALKGQLERSDP